MNKKIKTELLEELNELRNLKLELYAYLLEIELGIQTGARCDTLTLSHTQKLLRKIEQLTFKKTG